MDGYTNRRVVVQTLTGLTLAVAASGGVRTSLAQASMSRDETQAVLEEYVAALAGNGDFSSFFAEDIVVSMMDTGQEVRGREEAADVINYLHNVAFQATPELSTIVYGEGIASAELIFAGTQIEEFEGIPPVEGEFRVPYSVVWELTDSKIISLRLYQFATTLIAHLTALSEESSS